MIKISVLIFVIIAFSVCGNGGSPLFPLPTGEGFGSRKKESTPERSAGEFPVRLNGNSISAGNKTLDLNSDGTLVLNADGQKLASFSCFFKGRDKQTGKTLWIKVGNPHNYSATDSKSHRNGNEFRYEGVLKIGTLSWTQFVQKTMLLSSGRIRVECDYFPSPDPRYELELHSFWVLVPRAMANGHEFELSGRKIRIMPELAKTFLASGKETELTLTVNADNPSRTFTLSGIRGRDFGRLACLPVNKEIRISMTAPSQGKRRVAFELDLRRGVEQKSSSDVVAGVDFAKVENLTMPDRSSRNLLRNPSFEQEFHEYWISHLGFNVFPEKWEWKPFAIDDRTSVAGKRSLRIRIYSRPDRDFRSLQTTPNLGSSNVVLSPGKYVCSFYAKADAPGRILNVWFNRFRTGSRSGWIGHTQIRPGTEWKRYSFVFDVTLSKPTGLHLNAVSDDGSGFIWVDALQLEQGTTPSPFETKIVEGNLKTSAPDNFLSAQQKINAELHLTTRPSVRGKAAITVTDFYKEERFRCKLDFCSDSSGHAVLKLPFNGKLGKGLFLLRTDYSLESGERCYDQHRFAVADFLNGTHRLKRIFSKVYAGWEEIAAFDFPARLERARKVGFGAETHLLLNEPFLWEKYRAFGIEPIDGMIFTSLRRAGSRKNAGFGIPRKVAYRKPVLVTDKENLLIRDYKLDAGGTITPEWLAKLKEAVKIRVGSAPFIRTWRFGNEIFAAYPYEWWSTKNDPQEAAQKLALIQKAFAEAVREVNPKAQIMQGSPCNMSPAGGIADTDRLLAECNKLGVKFDIIGFHPYRSTPENPDLDADVQRVFAILKKNGYPDTTPLYWGEMMHWGPYEIPQWGTKSASWRGSPVTWIGNTNLSYDIGKTEQLSAAWRARSWLVALKYADRIITANSGNTNNFSVDFYQTPRASQLVSNTLANLLGDAVFRRDIRFAPYIRAWIFEDAQKRPVAAVWCHKESVDSGEDKPPVASADFGSTLESVIDLMNQERNFHAGRMNFPVMSAPLFFRGRPGTLRQMISAFEHARLQSGSSLSPFHLSLNPASPEHGLLTLENLLSGDFSGTVAGQRIRIPAHTKRTIRLPLREPLAADRIRPCRFPLTIRSDDGNSWPLNGLDFHAFYAKRVPESATIDSLDWDSLPRLELTNECLKENDMFRAFYRIGWNPHGLFLEVSVDDSHFTHREFADQRKRWDNDSLQVYFDALANARSNMTDGYDDDDYDYAIYPDARGKTCTVWRNRTADQQLTLGINAPQNFTTADDIPSKFIRHPRGYIYRIFFPGKYLLPALMKKGTVLGFGLNANNADDPALPYPNRRRNARSNAILPGRDCYNKPRLYPALLLWE